MVPKKTNKSFIRKAKFNSKDTWKMTTESFMKFFPMIQSSSPPDESQAVRDIFSISGVPGSWVQQMGSETAWDQCHETFYGRNLQML